MADSRPPIDAATKRAVRQRCGFGCVVCGAPLYEYDHLVPWSQVGTHGAENLVLLCGRHHGEKTRGLLPDSAVRDANADPHNLRVARSSSQFLAYSGQHCEAIVGSNRHVWPILPEGASTIPLLIDDTPIVAFTAQKGNLLLTLQLFNEANELLVQVVENELVYSADPWDVEFVGRRLTVRHAPGDIFVRIDFEPPNRVAIDRAHIWRNGIELDAHSDRTVVVADQNVIRSCTATQCTVGLAIGDCPPLGGAIYMGASRKPFATAPTEGHVLRISPRASQD